jgi:hypothetical protein
MGPERDCPACAGEDGYDPALENDQITLADVPGLQLDGVHRLDEAALKALYA